MLMVAKIDKLDMLNNIGEDRPAFTIWFAGCSAQCPDCHNPKLWSRKNGRGMAPGNIITEILLSDYDRYRTVILLGGEPLEQPIDQLVDLCKILKDMNYNIFLYTGKEIAQIPDKLIKYLDRVKTGRYTAELKQDGFPASSNQKLYRRVRKEGWLDKKAYFILENPPIEYMKLDTKTEGFKCR